MVVDGFRGKFLKSKIESHKGFCLDPTMTDCRISNFHAAAILFPRSAFLTRGCTQPASVKILVSTVSYVGKTERKKIHVDGDDSVLNDTAPSTARLF